MILGFSEVRALFKFIEMLTIHIYGLATTGARDQLYPANRYFKVSFDLILTKNTFYKCKIEYK